MNRDGERGQWVSGKICKKPKYPENVLILSVIYLETGHLCNLQSSTLVGWTLGYVCEIFMNIHENWDLS